MPEKESLRKVTQQHDFDESLSEILGALELIKRNIPNGEIKALQDKVTNIEESQSDLKEELKSDLKEIKHILLDPITGLIVAVNKCAETVKKNEEYIEKELKPKIEKLAQLESWKENVTRVLWLMVAGIISILFNIFFRN
jgi:predicted  nucleic acid-binding Zn-ribbon protein